MALFGSGPAGHTTWIDQVPRDRQVNSATLLQMPDVPQDRKILIYGKGASTRTILLAANL